MLVDSHCHLDFPDFAALGGARRIAAGVTLPTPTPVFPRYVDSAGSVQT